MHNKKRQYPEIGMVLGLVQLVPSLIVVKSTEGDQEDWGLVWAFFWGDQTQRFTIWWTTVASDAKAGNVGKPQSKVEHSQNHSPIFSSHQCLVGGGVCCDEVAVKHHQITQGAKHTACGCLAHEMRFSDSRESNKSLKQKAQYEPLPCQCYHMSL